MANKPPKKSAVEFSASLRADTMRVDERARTEVRVTGEGGVSTRREGLPPGGVREGETYRDVRVGVKMHSDPQSPPALAPAHPSPPRTRRPLLVRRRKAKR